MQFIEIGWSLVRVENTNLRIRVTQTTILNFLEIITARSKLSICIDAMVVFVKLRGMIDSITISLFVEKGNQSSNVFVWECRHRKCLHLGIFISSKSPFKRCLHSFIQLNHLLVSSCWSAGLLIQPVREYQGWPWLFWKTSITPKVDVLVQDPNVNRRILLKSFGKKAGKFRTFTLVTPSHLKLRHRSTLYCLTWFGKVAWKV